MHNEKASCLALHFAAYNLEHSFFLWKRMSRILCQWQNMCPIFSVLSFGRVFLYVFRWEMFGGGLCALDRGSNGQLPQGNCSMEEGGGEEKRECYPSAFWGQFQCPPPHLSNPCQESWHINQVYGWMTNFLFFRIWKKDRWKLQAEHSFSRGNSLLLKLSESLPSWVLLASVRNECAKFTT